MERNSRLFHTAMLAVSGQEAALEMREAGRFPFLADDPDCPDVMRLAALAEELGEVARCLHDNDLESLKSELVQLAGIAIAWASVGE